MGWTGVPNILLRKQLELGLSSDQLIILINIIRFWWKEEKLPYPSIEKLSLETGLTKETIEKIIKELDEKKLIKVFESTGMAQRYDLTMLRERLSSMITNEKENKELVVIVGDDGASPVDVIGKDTFIDYDIIEKNVAEVKSIRKNLITGEKEIYSRVFKISPFNKTAIIMFSKWDKSN